ncbi:AraC family transcriptional regulator [Flavobacterium sp. AC]|uniref:AraC family transcriptional regulator n=1 Tax=Flavobacterium azizsancarii TaxID=2961580 RepID=A0ABT4WF07_9FLAO|nr:AraC family transcriptional regulator [Flavobacterium azizsancarii]MDA6071045.1 AraC family transcriptional regulator [Flavobacterium azizsancarii]
MKLVQFEPLFIRYFSTSVWPFPLHNHNHYEFMFVAGGSGTHELNKISTEYKGDTMFFLAPEDHHDFYIAEECQFSVIKFLPGVLKAGINSSTTDYWDNLLTSLTRKWHLYAVEINNDVQFLNKISTIMQLMISEWQDNNQQVTEIHTNLLRSLLLLIDKRMKNANDTTAQYGMTQIERIQNYIHSHIHFPEKLTVKNLSNTFRLSESGLRGIFKKNMEMSLGTYISSLKIEMIKNRIRNSECSLSEIALEFGFTDSSHFNKFFQKHTAINPLGYRKETKVNPL